MNSLVYIAQSLPWTVAGLLVGYFMARATVAVESIADAVQETPVVETPPEKKRRFHLVHLVALVLVVLGIATAIQGYVQDRRTERLAVCQQAYSNGFADAIEVRSAATAEAQKALDDFFAVIAQASSQNSREVVAKAFADYMAKRAAAKKAQAEHPYPAPPRDLCKE